MSDLQRILDENPQNLTKEDLKPFVQYLRDKRTQFGLGDKAAGNMKKVSQGPKITDLSKLLGEPL